MSISVFGSDYETNCADLTPVYIASVVRLLTLSEITEIDF